MRSAGEEVEFTRGKKGREGGKTIVKGMYI